MSTKDFTFVVQGKLHINSIENIDNMLKYGKIIFSYYESDDKNLQEMLEEQAKIKDITLIPNKDIPDSPINRQNIVFQTYTTLRGLLVSDTKYSIKIRSDEKYYNFSEFIKTIIENEDKYNTINLFFRNVDIFGLHPSDHLIGSRTDLLVRTFKILSEIGVNYVKLTAEQKIFLCFLIAKNIPKFSMKEQKGILKQNCTITRLHKFEKFIIKYNSSGTGPKTYTEEDIELLEKDETVYNEIEEII